jgi:hypothetical protein
MITGTALSAATLAQPEGLAPFPAIGAQCHLVKSSEFLIANLELEFRLSHSESAFYKFLIANVLRFFLPLYLCEAGSEVLLEVLLKEADEVGKAENFAFRFEESGIGDLGLGETSGDLGDVGGVDVAFLRAELKTLAREECAGRLQLVEGRPVEGSLRIEFAGGLAKRVARGGYAGVGLDGSDQLIDGSEETSRGIEKKLIPRNVDIDGLAVRDFNLRHRTVAIVIHTGSGGRVQSERLRLHLRPGEKVRPARPCVSDAKQLLLNSLQLLCNRLPVACRETRVACLHAERDGLIDHANSRVQRRVRDLQRALQISDVALERVCRRLCRVVQNKRGDAGRIVGWRIDRPAGSELEIGGVQLLLQAIETGKNVGNDIGTYADRHVRYLSC